MHPRAVCALIGTTGTYVRPASDSGAGGHVGGENVVGMPVEVLPCAVVAHGRAGVGVAGGDLHVAKVHAGVEHGGDEGVPEHVRVHPREVHASGFGESSEASGGGVPVHSRAPLVPQERS
jgi:hypothetical protein